MTTKNTCNQLSMFDINGPDKLSTESVFQRESIIQEYAKDPKTVFFVSVSGGKDGQAMSAIVRKIVPDEQIIYVHAHLGDAVEHDGILDHIKRYMPTGMHLEVVTNHLKDFIDMVLLRGMFPSAQFRQCTSDLKTNPIDKYIRAEMKRRGATVGFNCIGLRSDESVPRSGRNPLFVNKRLTLKSGDRTIYDWLPAFHLSTEAVFETIYAANETPFHIYGAAQDENGDVIVKAGGNSRTSCRFCIMGCKQDLANAANWYPSNYAQMIALERVIGHTMFHKTVKKQPVKVSLSEKAGVVVDEVSVRRWMMVLSNRRQVVQAAKDQRDADKLAAREAKRPNAGKTGIDDDNLELDFG